MKSLIFFFNRHLLNLDGGNFCVNIWCVKHKQIFVIYSLTAIRIKIRLKCQFLCQTNYPQSDKDKCKSQNIIN